jgi:hypothetical protein
MRFHFLDVVNDAIIVRILMRRYGLRIDNYVLINQIENFILIFLELIILNNLLVFLSKARSTDPPKMGSTTDRELVNKTKASELLYNFQGTKHYAMFGIVRTLFVEKAE